MFLKIGIISKQSAEKSVYLMLFLKFLYFSVFPAVTATIHIENSTAYASESASVSADTILKKADEVRNPSESFSMVVDVITKGEEDARFEVLIKGKNQTLIRTQKPTRDLGRNMLMQDESMWAYVPNLKRAVRVSLNQKLTGQAANGDISRMRWHGDYEASVEKETKKEWILTLSANKRGLTYEKIRAWISKDSFHPTQAEYLTKQGKVLKTASFEGYKKVLGKQRPTEITIRDASNKSKASQIMIREMESTDFPNSLFNQNSLK